MSKNTLILIGIGVLILGGFLVWLFVASSKPLPGEKIADLGREHVQTGTEVEYNSNPPTSGPHYNDWIRPGVYKEPKEDGNLVHSLEHGYIVISYNCEKKVTSNKRQVTSLVYAHGVEEEGLSGDATDSADLSESFRSDECHELLDQLISIYEKRDKTKIIVVPRPNLDFRIALTAWNYIDKFDEFDESRILRFMDNFRDMGPEKTVEQPGE